MSRVTRFIDPATSGVVPANRHKIRTFQDLVERILVRFDGLRTNQRDVMLARQAVVDAQRDLPSMGEWQYLIRTAQVITEAEYKTGTISYTHTGGAYERLVTLVTGTWPTNAAFGTLYFGGDYYEVESRQSTTQITLSPNSNPGANVAAGTTYTWFRDNYPLPLDYRQNGYLLDSADTAGLYPLEYKHPDLHMVLTRNFWGQTTDRPEWWTIKADRRYLSGMAIVFGRPPNASRTYDFIYYSSGQPLHTEKYSAGTVTTSGTAATGTGTVWTSYMEGALIRFSENASSEPTSAEGQFSDTLGEYSPYVAEAVIQNVVSATSITLMDSVATLTGVKYVISDPLDVDTDIMYSALSALAEYYYARKTSRKDVPMLKQIFDDDLRRAKEADHRPRSPSTGDDAFPQGVVWGTVTGKP